MSDAAIRKILRAHADPVKAADALIAAANDAGGPDNITVAVIDYAGSRPVNEADRLKPRKTPSELPHGIAEKTRDALALLPERHRFVVVGQGRVAVHQLVAACELGSVGLPQ